MAYDSTADIEYIFNSDTNVMIMVNSAAIKKASTDENLKREKFKKDERKLEDALTNEDGMYIIKNFISIDSQANSYIVKKGFRLEKLNDVTACKLVEDGKAITVDSDEFELLRRN